MQKKIGEYKLIRQINNCEQRVADDDGRQHHAFIIPPQHNLKTPADVQHALQWFGSLESANLVKIVKWLRLEHGGLILLEEHCPEGALADHLMNIDAVESIRGLALGLHYLHSEKRMVHPYLHIGCCHIKSGRAAIGGVVRFGDFSCQKIQDSEAFLCSNPPETEHGEYGYHSNIWQLGVIFLQIAAGKQLSIQKRSQLEIHLEKVQPPYLKRLIDSMLNEDPRLRPSTKDVLRALGGKPPPIEKQHLLDRLIRLTEDSWYFRLSKTKLKSIEAPLFGEVQRLAEAGDQRAMFLFGRMLHQGTGCQKNLEGAKLWFEKAAAKGFAKAQCNLFLLEKDNELAKPYLQKGYELGEMRCRWYMARSYGFGIYGYEKNVPRGVSLMKLLPKDYPDMHYDLARMKAELLNRPNFSFQAVGEFKEGARHCHKKAMEGVGECYYNDDQNKLALLYYLLTNGMEGETIGSEASLSNSNGACYFKLKDKIRSRFWFAQSRYQGSQEAVANLSKLLLF